MNTKLLPTDLFERILSKRKRDTGTDLEQVGLKCVYNKYTVSFYGNLEDNYLLKVEEFGFMHAGKWVELSPTEAQEQAMQNILNKEVERVGEEVKRGEPVIDEDFDFDIEYRNSFI